MNKCVLILGLLVLALAVDYCQLSRDSAKIFIQKNETRLLNLQSYVKGYDLTFDADNAKATIFDSYQVSITKNVNLKDYKSLKSVDVRSYGSLIGNGILAMMAQKDNNQQIAIWAGQFEGYQYLPDFSVFRTFTLPSAQTANCFDARSADEKGGVILNCQTIPQTEQQTPNDLMCFISPNDTELNLGVNCNMRSSLAVSLSRRSKVLSLKKRTYLLSENKDITDDEQSINYIMIYYLNQKQQFVFANIIDGTQLAINPTLDISDYIVMSNNQIVVADGKGSRLIYFNYSVANEVQVAMLVGLQSKPVALSYSSRLGTLLVASPDSISEYDAANPSILIGKYEVDPNDNIITGLQANDQLVAFTTGNKNLFLYQRGQHKINYLLDRVEFPSSSMFVLSRQISFLYTFNITNVQAVSIAEPSVSFSEFAADSLVKIRATSASKVCEIRFQVKCVEDSSGIVNKQSLQDNSYKVDPTSGLSLNLKEFYGGANLMYNISEKTNPDFNVGINQIEAFNIKPTFGTAEKTAILAVDSSNFYFIGINSVKQNQVYVDLCQKKSGLITCSTFWTGRVPLDLKQNPVDILETKLRSNGDPIVIWTYSGDLSILSLLNLKTKSFQQQIRGVSQALPVSTIRIIDSCVILVSKKARLIEIYWDSDTMFSTFLTQSSFTPEELTSLEQFYPRDVVVDKSHPNTFFIKLPTRIARFNILDNKSVKFAGIVRDYESYILDSEWTFTFTGKNIITIRNKELKEEYYNPSLQSFVTLQKLPFNYADFSAIDYDQKSNFLTVSVKETANAVEQTMKVLVPDSGSVDAQYVEMKMTGQAKVSQNWFMATTNSTKVYYVNSNPELSVSSNLPDDMYKEDISLTLEIKSGQKSQKSKAVVQGINFPVAIKDNPSADVMKLPYNASEVEMKLNVEKFFTGPVSGYGIDCPFCQSSQIKLETEMGFFKNISQVTAAVDFVTVGTRIITISNNAWWLMNNNFEVIDVSHVPGQLNCNNIAYDEDLGLFVFCTFQDTAGQLLIQYDVVKDKFFISNIFKIPSEHMIRQFDEMFIYYSPQKSYIFILDNDETIDSNSKYSTVKVFSVVEEQFQFVTEWDSRSFGADSLLPINDFDLNRSFIFVTIGNYGMGYATFSDGKLIKPNTIKLSAIAEIKDFMLSSSYFKQIEMVGFSEETDEISLFITSTNSLSFIATFVIAAPDYIFKAVTEKYNRYGRQRLLNWHKVTDSTIFLSYYNSSTELATIVTYNRKTGVQNEFVEGVTVKLSKNLVQYHEVYITGDNKMLVSHLTDVPSAGLLMGYTLNQGYYLWLNYSKAGDFKSIDVYAQNSYHKVTHSQKIQFDSPPTPPPPPPPPKPDDDGVKWYIVVIVAASVLLAVGVAYGLFRYKQGRRSNKNVSLLTEKQENDDDADDTPKRNPLEERLNATTTVSEIKSEDKE